MTEELERAIEVEMEARLGRPCLFVTSGRLAVYIALRSWLSPGDRLLMSPVTDDVIFFTALAAGLRPVMAPLAAADGNIDLDQLPDEEWRRLGGVLTTNLYGLPDRVHELRARCDRLRIPLVEDAAHAIETSIGGRRIGTFGDVAAFSLSKHVGAGSGGVLAFSDENRRSELRRLLDASLAPGRSLRHAKRAGLEATESLIIASHLVWPARWLRRRVGMTERTAHRMPLDPVDLQQAITNAPDLASFDRWLRVDRHDYRVPLSARSLRRALRGLRGLEADRARRIDGVARLRELPLVAQAVRDGDAQPLFRVPLLVDDRDSILARLERHVLNIGYIYHPPLDDYAGREFAEPSALPEVARSWSRRVLPLDPLEADRILRYL